MTSDDDNDDNYINENDDDYEPGQQSESDEESNEKSESDGKNTLIENETIKKIIKPLFVVQDFFKTAWRIITFLEPSYKYIWTYAIFYTLQNKIILINFLPIPRRFIYMIFLKLNEMNLRQEEQKRLND